MTDKRERRIRVTWYNGSCTEFPSLKMTAYELGLAVPTVWNWLRRKTSPPLKAKFDYADDED